MRNRTPPAAEPKPMQWMEENTITTPPMGEEARREAGRNLRRVQNGQMLSMPVSRPMPSIGRGVHELRINDQTEAWRIIYYIGEAAIVVLEIFSKKTQTTPDSVILLCQKRLRQYIDEQEKKV